MFGFLLGFSYLSFVELLNAQRSSIIQNLKNEDIFEISSYKRTMHRNLKLAVSSKIFSFARYGEFKLLFKRKTKFREV